MIYIGDTMSYIKLNNNNEHLSLGNLFNQIKKLSINKSSAIQTEIFCILFNIDNISDTTVGNYCTGYRAIGNQYKQIYLNYKKKYPKDNTILLETINNLISIIEGIIHNYQTINDLNTNENLKKLTTNLFNIAKNDISVPNTLKKEILNQINNKEYYQALINMLFFIILEKKQPIKNDDLIIETIQDILNNTNISISNLKKYLEIQFKEGISLIPSLKKLAKENNPYALFELGNMEYNGIISGTCRYELAYNYHLQAANLNHPASNWMISHMILNKKIGSLSDDDISLAWSYLMKAKSLNSISSLNTIGLCYLHGTNPQKEINLNLAITYFKEAANKAYPYAYNNLGLIYEKQKDYQKALSYYLKSANLEESWACNKVGEFYRLGLGTNKDLSISYKYYLLGSESPIKNLYPWNILNLVKYFYLEGSAIIGIEKDLDKSIILLEKINYLEEAQELLLYTYYQRYLTNKSTDNLNNTLKYLDILNSNPKINFKQKKEIETTLQNLSTKITLPNNPSH